MSQNFDPTDETASFIRLMAQHGFEATVVWQNAKGKGAVTSNAGKEGIMRAAARLTIKDGAIERAARAMHEHMVAQPGQPAPSWEALNQQEREAIRTLVKVVIAKALEKTAETPSGVVV